ncbi:hypothetical protein KBC04_03315 [Candidatus Babeliales bacterium]|nr:hypothetical protein [Candidatus Babeliales bacterium]MBP9843919.1 hypothetical protein [Candidatus Babeliales bacterium]
MKYNFFVLIVCMILSYEKLDASSQDLFKEPSELDRLAKTIKAGAKNKTLTNDPLFGVLKNLVERDYVDARQKIEYQLDSREIDVDRAINISEKRTLLSLVVMMSGDVAYAQDREYLMRLAQILVKKGANLNSLDLRGHTPLYYAVEGIDFDMVKFLVKSGASVNLSKSVVAVKSKDPAVRSKDHVESLTPLDYAAQKVGDLKVDLAKKKMRSLLSPEAIEAQELKLKESFDIAAYLYDRKNYVSRFIFKNPFTAEYLQYKSTLPMSTLEQLDQKQSRSLFSSLFSSPEVKEDISVQGSEEQSRTDEASKKSRSAGTTASKSKKEKSSKINNLELDAKISQIVKVKDQSQGGRRPSISGGKVVPGGIEIDSPGTDSIVSDSSRSSKSSVATSNSKVSSNSGVVVIDRSQDIIIDATQYSKKPAPEPVVGQGSNKVRLKPIEERRKTPVKVKNNVTALSENALVAKNLRYEVKSHETVVVTKGSSRQNSSRAVVH